MVFLRRSSWRHVLVHWFPARIWDFAPFRQNCGKFSTEVAEFEEKLGSGSFIKVRRKVTKRYDEKNPWVPKDAPNNVPETHAFAPFRPITFNKTYQNNFNIFWIVFSFRHSSEKYMDISDPEAADSASDIEKSSCSYKAWDLVLNTSLSLASMCW